MARVGLVRAILTKKFSFGVSHSSSLATEIVKLLRISPISKCMIGSLMFPKSAEETAVKIQSLSLIGSYMDSIYIPAVLFSATTDRENSHGAPPLEGLWTAMPISIIP